MRERLLAFLLPHIVDELIKAFDINTVKHWVDEGLDKIEDAIELSENPIDDSFLPMLYAIRNILDIPDNDSAASSRMA